LGDSGTTAASYFRGLAIDEPWQRTDIGAANTNRVYLADGLGSIVALTDTNQVVDTQYFYDPFGGTTNTGTGNKNSYQFTGRENDATGLYYYRARYYHPALGRFISEDPLGMMSGDANVYVYGRNSSLNLIDPSGMDPNGLENQLINLPFNLIVGVFQAAGYLGAVVGVGEVADGVMGAILGDIGAEIAPAELGAAAEGGLEAEGTPSITTDYAVETQGGSLAEQAALADAQSGATLYRTGELGTSMAGESQYYSLQNPLTPGYANSMGMPNVTPNFIMGGTLNQGASAIANQAGALGANAGQGIQIVTSPGGVVINWFYMP